MKRNLIFNIVLISIFILTGLRTEALPVVSKKPNPKEVKQQKLPLMQRLTLKIMQKRLKKVISKNYYNNECSDIHMMGKDQEVIYGKVKVNRAKGIIHIDRCDLSTGRPTGSIMTKYTSEVCRIEFRDGGPPEYFSCPKPEEEKPETVCSHVFYKNEKYEEDYEYMSVYVDENKRKVYGYKCTYNGHTTDVIKRIPMNQVCRIEYHNKEVRYFPCEEPPKTTPPTPRKTKLDGLAFFALLFAFILPPLGFFLSIFSISKINANRYVRGKGIAVFALIVSLLIMGAIGVALALA